MAEINTFEDLIVWQKAHGLFLEAARDSEQFPNGRAASVIANQLLRSASSISANIAEGFGRRMGKEYTHYLIVARGSTTETIDWYLKCRDLPLTTPEIFKERPGILDQVLKMLNRMVSQQLNRRLANSLTH